ncbi:MAG: lipid kinase [Leptolyngbya foveolarum]|uniref:Lipid kinase n=1 Tax=Leptolyngbya foveolarum TaxID=47253 RepID=A0A2W4VL55_9CYAN|nr:MAG: lipid kinase [Leptolyngbya foveolarum]
MSANIYLIYNPVSGQGDAAAERSRIEQLLGEKLNLTVLETTPEESAEQLTEQAIAQGAEGVVASGGDGTVSAVAGKLVGTGLPLGIIPRGTANAIAAAFGISDNIDNACTTILEGIPRKIDVGSCNGKPLLLLAGIGLEAEVISQANRQLKNKLGAAAYILSAFQQVRELDPFSAVIETPDRIISFDASGITVANAAPPTSVLAQGPSDVVPFDGLLDITIFAPEGAGSAIAASYNLFQTAMNRRSSKREDIGYFRCSALTIKTDTLQKVVLDGEMIGETPIEIRCIPEGLVLMTPKEGTFDPPEKLEGLPNLKIQHK